MKRLLFTALSVALVAFGTHAQQAKIKKDDDKVKAKSAAMHEKEMKMKGQDMGMNIMYPYKAEYSSQFTLGSPEQARMILQLWKDWDENDLDRNASYFADSVLFEEPDGTVFRGKEALMKNAKEFRNSLTSARSTVEAWLPMRSVDRNEDWVAVWGYEEDTTKDGKVTTERHHEIWGFNKDGKISFVRQYTGQMPKQ